MAKDPAFLFYSSDFLTGTMLMNHEQVGKYIRLLCLQHQKGRFTEKDMLSICKAYDEDVLDKFSKDKDGKYYNERLEKEMVKRQLYTESRRNNAKNPKKQKAYADHMDDHMENENENINRDNNKDRGVGKGIEEIELIPKILEAAEMNQYDHTKQRNTDFVKAQWEIFKLERINDPPTKQKDYIKYPARLYQHFLNWLRNKFPKNDKRQTGTAGKSIVFDAA